MFVACLCSIVLSLAYTTSAHYCDGGHYCAGAHECCEGGCCYTHPPQPAPAPPAPRQLPLLHWYFWVSACALCAVCALVWCVWRRRARLRAWRSRRAASDRDSAGSCYLPPQYSRCNSFLRAPPPYNEVTSKPDLYPLVLTYGDGGDKAGGNYLMVHYFRNYIIRPPGSVSATSTADSLNSSLMCNATNEANTLIPPPYCADANEWRGLCDQVISSHRSAIPRSVSTMTYMPSPGYAPTPLRIDDAPDGTNAVHSAFPGLIRLDSSPEPLDNRGLRASLLQTASRVTIEHDLEELGVGHSRYRQSDAPMRPRLGFSPEPSEQPASSPSEEIETWGTLYRSMLNTDIERSRCASPPRPTSPTMESSRRPDVKSKVKTISRRKTSLYMPLNSNQSGRRCSDRTAFSISAPTTPCGVGLVPTLLTLSQRMSGSMLSSRSSRLARQESQSLLENEESSSNAVTSVTQDEAF